MELLYSVVTFCGTDRWDGIASWLKMGELSRLPWNSMSWSYCLVGRRKDLCPILMLEDPPIG